MITTRTFRVALAALALGLVATAAATAAGGGRGHNVLYQFRGHLQSAVSYAGETALAAAHAKIAREPGRFLIPLSEASRRESFVR